MFILTQLNINQRQRLWALMDTHTRQPLLYPLIYLIDQLALRSSATQSASLQALKFFYEFWHQKHGVTFCFSFYSSNHNPLIAIDELTAFFHYLENTHLYVPALTIRSTTQTTPQRRTNIRHIHSVIRFIRYLINTYISPRYLDGSPKELTRLATQLTGRLSIHKAEFRTLTHSRQMSNGTTHKHFRSLTAEMVMAFYQIITPGSISKKNPLNEFSHSAPSYVSKAISKAILSFSPPDYQAAVARGEAALPTITPTDLRHNVGHSLAMQGGSAEEIAHILGHTSLTVAKYYILATPALALIRAKALGTNPVWQSMVAMMLTGELTSSTEWQGQRVVGIVGDQLHDGIGGCTRGDGECPFCEVRCCYGCLYYRPFTDGDHQAVLESVVKEVDELISISDSVGNARNPLISIHETTQFEIQSVIARCRFHQEKGGVR
ncbi:TPA: site-specific integrase [Klebsiella pneumoniae]|nr:site-specific integrase [Klebsiella pneumoniae]